MTSQMELNQLLIEWDKTLTAYGEAAERAAFAEAEHKRRRARGITTEKHRDPKAPLSLCEALADADDDVAAALGERLMSAAAVDALKGKLAWFRSSADALRSAVASDRENAKLYSTHSIGA